MWSGRELRQLRTAVEIPQLRDVPADEPPFHLHRRLAARARALLPARRHPCGAGLVPERRARARDFEAVLLELNAVCESWQSGSAAQVGQCREKRPAKPGSTVNVHCKNPKPPM